MSAKLLILAAAVIGGAGLAVAASRVRPVDYATSDEPFAPEEQPVPLPLPPPPPPRPGRLSPQDVLALLPEADPEGWMPPAYALAFVEVESGFNPTAYRFERHLNEASYGLMQVLASTARDMGLTGSPEEMYDPGTSLRIGIAYSRWTWDFLSRRLGSEPTEAQWIGAYNAGVGNVLRGFIPQGYVRKFTLAKERYQL